MVIYVHTHAPPTYVETVKGKRQVTTVLPINSVLIIWLNIFYLAIVTLPSPKPGNPDNSPVRPENSTGVNNPGT